MIIRSVAGFFFMAVINFSSVAGQQSGLSIDSPNKSKVLKDNKIKHITEHRFNKQDGKIDTSGLYEVNPKGEITRYDYYFDSGKKITPMTKIIRYDSLSGSKTLITAETYPFADSLIIYASKTNYYCFDSTLYRTVEKNFLGNSVIDEWVKDTIDTKKSFRSILTLNGNDTVRLITYVKSSSMDTYTLREKNSGKWNYEEIQVTEYTDGKFTHFKRTLNGKLVLEYGPSKDTVQAPYDRDFNPLPYTDQNRIDSSVVKIRKGELPYAANTDERMLRTEFYVPYQSTPVSITLFLLSGLIFSKDNTNEKFLTYYTYERYR